MWCLSKCNLGIARYCKTNQDTISAKNETLHLAPGMAVTAEIKTRKKKIIEYFMDPFIKYKDEGLRER
jgi:hypothetical protein